MSSNKERQAKKRAKLKEDPERYQAHLQKDRQRKAQKLAQARAKMTEKEKEEFLLKERLRIRKLRAAKKSPCLLGEPSTGTPYRSSQSLGKALKRARTSLPKSPTKQRLVVSKLAESVGLKLTPESGPSGTISSSGITDDTKKSVYQIYHSDDISWQAPGRKDHITVREKNEDGLMVKRTEQVRYMLMSLREAYSKFKEANPSLKIGVSKFCDLRPAHVKLFDQIPHQVCVCIYHENVRLLLVALKDHTELKAVFSEFVEQLTCDTTSKACMSGKCSDCANSISKYAPTDNSKAIHYQQWQNSDGRMEKVEITGKVEDCFEELKSQVGAFLLHTFIKRKQAASFKALTEKSDGKRVVLQVDFSENATIASQREVQSAHWNHGQATLFTAHTWIENEHSVGHSMVIVSDDLNHTKHSIYVFMEHILTHLKATYPDIEIIDVFSDGPTSQFKQRYLFSNLHSWEEEHDLKITWNFFATSHGKGVVDGIGGTLKRAVWRKVKAEAAHISCASEYAALGKEVCPNMHIEFVSQEEVSQLTPFLNARWENVQAVPRSNQVHCVKPIGSDRVQVADTSDSTDVRVCQIRNTIQASEQQEEPEQTLADTEVAVGDWVLVTYDSKEYPGEVVSINENQEVQVNVMHESGPHTWKWPLSKDMIFYSKSDIVRILNPPVAAGHRGQFRFPDFS